MRTWWWATLLGCGLWAGCGTTKWTDTSRTATEQLLISDSMDRAVSQLDFRAVAGKKVFVDDAPIKGMTDSAYLVSTLRQQVLDSGGILKEPKDQADYILEVRAGALGTDRHDVLFGVPATTMPTIAIAPGIPSQIPEIPFVKKTDQRAVTKIALFLYNRQTGRPVWQSGASPEESRAKAWWVLGAGPFQRGTIYHGTKFAGDRVKIPLVNPAGNPEGAGRVAVNDPAYFVEPKEEPRPEQKPPATANVKDGAAGPKDQAAGGSGKPAAPGGTAAAGTPPPAGSTTPATGTSPSGAASPGVVPASHTAPASPSTPPAGWTPPAVGPGPGRTPDDSSLWRDGGVRDRVLLLPPISPFDE